MNRILFIILFILLSFKGVSKVLISLELNYKYEIGHSVSMFYSCESISEIQTYISQLDTFSERAILKSFGLPLLDFSLSDSHCILLDSNKQLNFCSLFKNRFSTNLKINSRQFTLKIKLLKANYTNCIFQATTKYWASYDVNFPNVAVLISTPKIFKFTNAELKEINRLKKLFGKCCS